MIPSLVWFRLFSTKEVPLKAGLSWVYTLKKMMPLTEQKSLSIPESKSPNTTRWRTEDGPFFARPASRVQAAVRL